MNARGNYLLLGKRIAKGERFIGSRFPETNSASGKFTRESLSDNFRSNQPLNLQAGVFAALRAIPKMFSPSRGARTFNDIRKSHQRKQRSKRASPR